MKRLVFVIGLGAGFILGSKAGTGPYKKLEEKVRSISHRPEVEDAVDRAAKAASERAAEVIERVHSSSPRQRVAV